MTEYSPKVYTAISAQGNIQYYWSDTRVAVTLPIKYEL